jgi:hypothetical protein
MAAEHLMLQDRNRTDLRGKRPALQWILLGAMAPALLWAAIAASAAQGLPLGGGPVPPVRRGADGQIETVLPNTAQPEVSRPNAAPPAIAPKASPSGVSRNSAAPAVQGATRRQPPQPVITVTPSIPKVPDTTPIGAVVAIYSVKMSDGSPFTGTVRFGAPYYDGNGVFALSGNNIIVNPSGPGLGRNKTTITDHITLEATP